MRLAGQTGRGGGQASAAETAEYFLHCYRELDSRLPKVDESTGHPVSGQDVLEYGEVPAAIDAPNLLGIGAVDRFGNWATFTNSNPERVRVFDHGVEVDSLIPNGSRVPLSGTSMASPNVANLAGKVLAANPSLTPQQVIAIIVETATPIAPPFGGRIAHEVRAVTRARRTVVGRGAGTAGVPQTAP